MAEKKTRKLPLSVRLRRKEIQWLVRRLKKDGSIMHYAWPSIRRANGNRVWIDDGRTRAEIAG